MQKAQYDKKHHKVKISQKSNSALTNLHETHAKTCKNHIKPKNTTKTTTKSYPFTAYFLALLH
ncbi:hypothetical protein [Helicobacter macacae]|uniref:hypothetical protein n=1 Tax=Helicobacter macacae TaxID=398626 RepID=UPI0004151B3C|nr:hypothetical protein [Helicobacter macacae]